MGVFDASALSAPKDFRIVPSLLTATFIAKNSDVTY